MNWFQKRKLRKQVAKKLIQETLEGKVTWKTYDCIGKICKCSNSLFEALIMEYDNCIYELTIFLIWKGEVADTIYNKTTQYRKSLLQKTIETGSLQKLEKQMTKKEKEEFEMYNELKDYVKKDIVITHQDIQV